MSAGNRMLAEVLTRRIKELGTNPRQLAGKVGLAYDRVRKVCKGDTFHGPKTLRPLCKELGLNYDEMAEMVGIDRLLDKGLASIEVLDTLKNDPSLVRIAAIWHRLGAKDKDALFAMASSMAYPTRRLIN